ncbi:nucleoside 2-deoxyribosyltransferase [Flavobacterium sp. JP2137]|uniref:nucleoside 2-deoxyribosyltransferase n=1 Tax=Flavobacterium sp. JP2137 TaxID=3414510 RepID=UPI003D2FA901
MKAYIAVNYKNRKNLSKELIAIGMALNGVNVESMIFVDQYLFDETNEREMMRQAMMEIDRCSFLVAECTYKGIGIGIEAGYAKAKKKPIIYLRHISAEHATTLAGISDVQLLYSNPKDLFDQLSEFLSKAIVKK